MIAHVAIRRIHLGDSHWLYAHGWVLGSATGAGLATSRAEAIRKACIEVESAGASGIALPAHRDWAWWHSKGAHVHTDPAAVAVALRAASLELMRECIRRRGAPDLLGGGSAAIFIDKLGGTLTVAAVLGCDAAQVVRWRYRGIPAVRLDALRRELEAMR